MTKTCSYCKARPVKTRGLCSAHYGDMSMEILMERRTWEELEEMGVAERRYKKNATRICLWCRKTITGQKEKFCDEKCCYKVRLRKENFVRLMEKRNKITRI